MESTTANRVSIKRSMRLGVSVVLLAVIYSRVDLPSLLATLSRISWATAIALLALYAIGQFISAVKWRIFIHGVGMHSTLKETERAYFLGMFVNSFGLGTLGGDAARCVALKPAKGNRAAVLATVVADRLHGLMVLVTIGAVSMLFVRPAALGALAVPLALLAVLALAAAWWMGPRVATHLFPVNHRFGAAAAQAVNAFPAYGAPLLRATGISIAFHILQIGMVYLAVRELGVEFPAGFLFAVVPIVNVGASLPISINGLGVREALYVFFFVPEGATAEVAVALSAVWILTVTTVSMLGGLLTAPGLLVGSQPRE